MTILTMTQQLAKGLVLLVTWSILPFPSSQNETILIDVGVVAIIGLSMGPGAQALSQIPDQNGAEPYAWPWAQGPSPITL